MKGKPVTFYYFLRSIMEPYDHEHIAHPSNVHFEHFWVELGSGTSKTKHLNIFKLRTTLKPVWISHLKCRLVFTCERPKEVTSHEKPESLLEEKGKLTSKEEQVEVLEAEGPWGGKVALRLVSSARCSACLWGACQGPKPRPWKEHHQRMKRSFSIVTLVLA